jgi:hypothetical protein
VEVNNSGKHSSIAYYHKAKNIAVKSFIVQAFGANVSAKYSRVFISQPNLRFESESGTPWVGSFLLLH